MLHTKPPSLLSLKAASIKTSNSKTSKRPKRFNARLFPYVSTVFVIAFSAQAIADQSAWTLMWSDEFEYQGLPDKAKWGYEEGFVRNQELQYYTRARKKNVRVENGTLIIEAHKESLTNKDYLKSAPLDDWQKSRKTSNYTSAAITTQGRASWTYGRVEVKAKLPKGRGIWPAIWMLGLNMNEVGWPQCGEIDIMENVGFDPNVIHTTVHTSKFNHTLGTQLGEQSTVIDPHNTYHLYGIEWFPERIDFFVDNNKVFTFSNDGSGEQAWPFFAPQYLLLNVAIGGGWGGQQGVDPLIFPQKMTIDYVRVYQQTSQ
ncbi:MAG: glycoside hydrolase [Alteromonadaceae bacterium]|nr:MAG: glycoside hydrolase [Alteromonadaceae bacterium]